MQHGRAFVSLLCHARRASYSKLYERSTRPRRPHRRSDSLSLRAKKKKQPDIVALENLSFEVAPGEIFGLLGPNGAGKSTTVGILTTRVRPTAGVAWIGEYDVWAQQVAVKKLLGVVAQRPNLDFTLTAREILLFHGAYFGLDSQTRTQRADSLLDRFQLTRPLRSNDARFLGRHDAASLNRARHDARSAGAVS